MKKYHPTKTQEEPLLIQISFLQYVWFHRVISENTDWTAIVSYNW